MAKEAADDNCLAVGGEDSKSTENEATGNGGLGFFETSQFGALKAWDVFRLASLWGRIDQVFPFLFTNRPPLFCIVVMMESTKKRLYELMQDSL